MAEKRTPGELARDAMALRVPRPAPQRLPLAAPVAPEPTLPGGLAPAPGSAGPPRSLSPPSFASPVEEAAIRREADRRGERVVVPRQAEPAPVVLSSRRVEYGIEPGTRNWLIALATMLLGTGGVAVYGAVRDPSPPAVQEAPKRVDGQERELRRLRDDIAECRSDVREVEGQQRRHDDRLHSLEGKIYELEKRTPKINP